MYNKVREYIKAWRMLGCEDKVIAGISGGADSVCLLFMLLRLKEEMGFEIAAVHVHHGIRGETADRDEEYVRSVCEREGVELFSFHEDVRGYAKEHDLTEEEAGREVRRKCFLAVMEAQGGTRIATAHHRNDNAETVLWNLCRGTGLKGMGGISPKNGVWIRPLLCLERTEIESYLEMWGISYCTDETNLEDDYTRNRIRNHVLPYLKEHINQRSVLHITECAAKLERLGGYIEAEAKRYMESCIKKRPDGGIVLVKEQYERIPDALRPEVAHRILCAAAGRQKDIEEIHVRSLLELMDRQVGRKIDLPYGLEAVRRYEGIRLRKKEEPESMGQTEKKEEPERSRDSESASAGVENPKFGMRIFEKSVETITFSQKNYTKWFDYDIISNTVKIRHRQPGDYIVIDKAGRRQKLKQYFINEKIPRENRDEIWLAADGHEIMWIVGYRQSQAYQITDDTKRILEISFYGGKSDGRDD